MIFDVEIQCGSLIRPAPLIGGLHVMGVLPCHVIEPPSLKLYTE